MNQFHDSFFRSNDGLKLYRRSWGEAKKGVVLLVHGFGDHLGRYQFLVKTLCDSGFQIEGFDCRGHGRSEGKRGHIDSFAQYIDDLHRFVEQVRGEIPRDVPLFLLGHSQGGHLVLRYGIEYRHAPFHGVIASSPFLGVEVKVPFFLRLAAHTLSLVRPSFALPTDLDISLLTHDLTVIEETKRDSLYGRVASSRWYTESIRAIEETIHSAKRFHFPLLFQVAGEDRIVDAKASLQFFQEAGSKEKRCVEYPGYYHEIYNETPDRRSSVFADLLRWLNEHCPS